MIKIKTSDEDELIIARKELVFQKEEKEKLVAELGIANKELAYQDDEKEKRAAELGIANIELAYQDDEKEKRAAELGIANKEKGKRAEELGIANTEKGKRAEELGIANKEKEKRAEELGIANKELAYQDEEKEKRAAELLIANKELVFQNAEKEKRAAELGIANKELAFQNKEKEKRAAELSIANIELAYQNKEKEKRAAELSIANIELAYQNDEKEKRAEELTVANKELAFQNKVNEKRAAELVIANKELAYQNKEKEKRAAELSIANIELAYQNKEKEKRAAELFIANKELIFQNKEKEKREIATKELEAFSYSVKLASQYSLSLIEASLDPLVTISTEGKITDTNEATVNITGIDREILIGSDFFDYFTEPQKAREVYQEVFAKGSVADSPLTLRHKDGKLTDVLFNGSVYKDDRGNVLGVVIVARDVTHQNVLQREREQTLSYAEGILGTMREPLLVLDKHLRVKSANDAFYSTFSITAKETEGTLVYELKNRRWDTPQLREALEKILPQKSAFNDLEITFDFPVIGSKVMLLNGRRLIQSEKGEELILLAMQDITEQRVLQQRNDSFMSMASHELKTPVTTIKTLVQILQIQYENSNDKTLVEYLTTIGQQIEQLTKLVSDLLDVSKIKADKFELEEKTFDFDTLATEIVKSCQLLSPQHTITIQGNTHAQISGDRNSVSRVFINLLVNAIKYSPNADTIIITLSRNLKDVRVGVQDFGIGIAKDHQDKIFERFFQVGNDSGQSFAGLGIGLYISAAIVVQHRGRIWVESVEAKPAQPGTQGRVGGGSTFFFELPVLTAEMQDKNTHAYA